MPPSGQRHWPLSSWSSEQRRISGGGTLASTGGVGLAGMIDVTVALAPSDRVCAAGFKPKCFAAPDGRERFNRLEICPADAFCQRPVSRDILWVVERIIVNLASSP